MPILAKTTDSRTLTAPNCSFYSVLKCKTQVPDSLNKGIIFVYSVKFYALHDFGLRTLPVTDYPIA